MSLEALKELQKVLRSKGNMSQWEQEMLQSSVSIAAGDFLFGAAVSFAAVWSTFWAMPRTARVSISGWAGLVGGRWTGGRKLDKQIEKLLDLQGTRIQAELATLILTEFQNEKSLVKLVRKHYYSEQVFGDLNPDISLFRWRPRNLYADSASNFSQFNEINDKNEPLMNKRDYFENNNQPDKLGLKQNNVENLRGDLFVDPLEMIFGYAEEGSKEVMNQSEAAQIISRKQIRAHKRAHRRRRSHESDETD